MTKLTINLLKTAFIGGLLVMYSCGGTTETADKAVEETTPTEEIEAVNEDAETSGETASLDLSKGEEVYMATCKVCHQENGQGIEGTFPPLANSDYLMADVKRAMHEVVTGKSGEVTVNGVSYNSTMPANVLTDEQLVDVMNYILNSWGNNGGTITLEDVVAAK